MLQRNGLRLLLEMAVIVATAAVTGFVLDLQAWAIVTSVIAVWLAITVFEYSRSHLRLRRRGALSRRVVGPSAESLPPLEPVVERVRVLTGPTSERQETTGVVAVVEAPVPSASTPVPAAPEESTSDEWMSEPEPFVESVRVVSRTVSTNVEPTEEPAAASSAAGPAAEEPVERSVALEPAPETAPEPEPEPEPAPPAGPPALQLEQDRPPASGADRWPRRREPEHEQPASQDPERPEPEPEPESQSQSQPRPEPSHVPVGAAAWSWNVWNLERVVRERASSNEELNYLLLYLRDYANPAGMLPPDFDALVRESFGDLLAAPA